ncbi:MAG: hypothetical protein MUP98_09720 [Candidatus Aminicenantes bacterium]|nr:hypothetical protein [Candidatus Aminicenantes bacterium]
MKIRIVCLILLLVNICGIGYTNPYSEDYFLLPGLFDLRTDLSDGVHSLEEIIELAKGRGFNVIFLNEHDLMVLEYGIWPLQSIIKKRVTRPSILDKGPSHYLKIIQEASKKYPEMILIPGSESSPFYYWEGTLFKRNLTVRDYERHLLVVGLDHAQDYEGLPVIHNNLIPKFRFNSIPVGIFVLLLFFFIGLILIKKRGIFRYMGIIIAFLSFLLVINDTAYKRPRYDPYQGNQGIAPYQTLIDYVNAREGMVFWNHPETNSGQGKIGPIQRDTPPYPQVLSESLNYTGFAALYAEGITITEPGGLWDQILLEYCEGKRAKPIWGISTADFHEEGHAGEKLGNFPTVFLVKEKSKKNILEALKRGRMYAYRGDVDLPRLNLKEFYISDSESTEKGVMGEEIQIMGSPEIHILISTDDPREVNPLKVRLVRDGKLLKEFSGETPLKIIFQDELLKPGKKVYYRLDMRDSRDRIVVSNPIFVLF